LVGATTKKRYRSKFLSHRAKGEEKMGRGTELNAFKRDNCIVDFIREQKGEANAVSGKEIARHLNENGFPTKTEQIHSLVSRVKIERRLPICVASYSGYYWATSTNDIKKSIDVLQKRVDGILHHIEHLKSFIIE
jgi:hypothetical protein